MTQLTGYLAYIEERIKRGSMAPTALAKATAAVRRLPPAQRTAFLSAPTDTSPPIPKTGPLRTRSIPLALANAFVAQWHRHLGPVVGHKFSLRVSDNVGVRGVVIVGRPVARHLDDGHTLEVTRVATDGTRNSCSALLGAVRRYILEGNRAGRWKIDRIVTYTLPGESGSSLRGAGWSCDGIAGGGAWARAGKTGKYHGPSDKKIRWALTW
jgi:hypothetical protein